MVVYHTRKKHRNTLRTVCHPKINTNECLPSNELEGLGRTVGAPSSLKGKTLRQWMKRRTRCATERCLVEKSVLEGGKKKEPSLYPTQAS
jgi:hypothetical protein